MTNAGECADDDAYATKLRFRANALMEELERIRVAIVRKAHEVTEAAAKVIDVAVHSVKMPEPDRDRDREPLGYVRNDEGPRLHKEKPVGNGNARVSMWVAVVSSGVSIMTVVFFAGRFTAQTESTRSMQAQQDSDIRTGAAVNSRQDVTLGIIQQQYTEITRRLNSIETKVDEQH